MREARRRRHIGSILLGACMVVVAGCGDAPTSSAPAVPTPNARDVSLRIVDAGTPTIAALLANQGVEPLAIGGCPVVEERRGDAWVALTQPGCPLVQLVVMPGTATRLGIPPAVAAATVRVRVWVRTLRDGAQSRGALQLSAETP